VLSANNIGVVSMTKCDLCYEPINTKTWLTTWDSDMELTLNVCKWCNPSEFKLSSEVNSG
jgi:hypothetical protein